MRATTKQDFPDILSSFICDVLEPVLTGNLLGGDVYGHQLGYQGMAKGPHELSYIFRRHKGIGLITDRKELSEQGH
jgi:hypothetical protein